LVAGFNRKAQMSTASTWDASKIADDTTYVLLDESGQLDETKPIVVGACVVPNLRALETEISALYELHRESPQLEGGPSFEDFVKKGFHYSGDPWEIQTLFIDNLSRLHGYRAHIAFSFGAGREGETTKDVELRLYRRLLPDVILSARSQKLVLLFETNDSLNGAFKGLVEEALEEGRRKSRQQQPIVSIHILQKQDLWSLSIVDYCLAVVSNWIESGQSDSPKKREAKNYKAIRENLAILLDAGSGTRSTRRSRKFK
jgi:hypothetical protein